MTAQEDLARRVERDTVCRAVQKKIDEGKADFADTARYTDRAAELLGMVLADYVPDMPPDERETLCKALLRQRYLDTNAMLDAVQRTLDDAQGLHLAPQIADYPEERVNQAAHSLADETVPMETIQRRAKSAPATIARSFHDDYIEKNAAFRSSAGLKCYITRNAAAKCCEWCTKMAGRYRYGEEPEDVYRRHDNCSCTVTYENGRKRQDVWSKRKWEAPAPGAGAGEPVRLTKEQAATEGASESVRFTESESSKLKAEYPHTLVNTQMLIDPAYRRLFNQFEESSDIERKIYIASRSALLHRRGTKYEDLYFINTETGKVLSRTDYNVEKKVNPSKRMMKMVNSSPDRTIIAIHNHPESGTPSIDDIHVADERKYKYGIVACHNGNLFQYSVTGDFDAAYVDFLLDNLHKRIYNKVEDELGAAQRRAEIQDVLNQLRENNIEMKVVLWE